MVRILDITELQGGDRHREPCTSAGYMVAGSYRVATHTAQTSLPTDTPQVCEEAASLDARGIGEDQEEAQHAVQSPRGLPLNRIESGDISLVLFSQAL